MNLMIILAPCVKCYHQTAVTVAPIEYNGTRDIISSVECDNCDHIIQLHIE